METICFCHGAPGSPADLRLFAALPDPGRIIALDLLARPQGPVQGALAQFDETGDEMGGAVHLIGFSIGAMVACTLAARRPERVARLTLISAAAPLGLGDFLPAMAGRPVFEAARRPALFAALTFAQGLALRLAPEWLEAQLFVKAGGAERALFDDPDFRTLLRAGLHHSFLHRPGGYKRLVRAYVQDWSACLSQIRCPVALWHGEEDLWAPVAMAQALAAAIPGGAALHLLPGGGHYSTLRRASLNGFCGSRPE